MVAGTRAARMRGAVAAIIVLLLLLPAARAGDPGPVEKPAYAVGDYWSYHLESLEAFVFLMNGTMNVRVVDIARKEVRGVNHTVVILLFEGRGTLDWSPEARPNAPENLTGSWAIDGFEWWESTGLKLVRRYLRVTGEGTGQTSGQTFHLDLVNETRSVLLEDTWRFPIAANATGRIRADTEYNSSAEFVAPGMPARTYAANGTFNETIDLVAEGWGRPVVPRGTFDALRMNETLEGGSVRHEYAPAVGADVRREIFNETARVQTLDLLAFRYRHADPPVPTVLDFRVPLAVIIGLAGVAIVLLVRRRRPGEEWRAFEDEVRDLKPAREGGPGGPPKAP